MSSESSLHDLKVLLEASLGQRHMKDWGVARVVEHMPGKCETLRSILSMAKEEQTHYTQVVLQKAFNGSELCAELRETHRRDRNQWPWETKTERRDGNQDQCQATRKGSPAPMESPSSSHWQAIRGQKAGGGGLASSI